MAIRFSEVPISQVPSLQTFAANCVCKNASNFQSIEKLPEDLQDLVVKIFKKYEMDLFEYGPGFNNYLEKNEISLHSFEKFRLELIKIGIINKSISKEKASLNKLLLSASFYGNLETVKYLILNGADIEATDKLGETALMLAARTGHLELVRHLIDNGANINHRDNRDRTVLMYAVSNVHLEIVQYLVGKGADMNAKNQYGENAVMLAGCAGERGTKIGRYLIDKDAEIGPTDPYQF